MGTIGNVLMSAARAYGCTKLMQNTGMNLAEAYLYKDVFQSCNKYYSQKAVIALKSIFAK